VSWRRERGRISVGRVGGVEDTVEEGVRPGREEWQWVMRARREVTEVCRRSMSAVRDDGGMESGCWIAR